MKNKFAGKVLMAVFFFITANLNVWAEPLPTPSPSFFPVSPDGTDDPGTPINQITIWLLIAGILLACYFIQKQKSAIKIS